MRFKRLSRAQEAEVIRLVDQEVRRRVADWKEEMSTQPVPWELIVDKPAGVVAAERRVVALETEEGAVKAETEWAEPGWVWDNASRDYVRTHPESPLWEGIPELAPPAAQKDLHHPDAIWRGGAKDPQPDTEHGCCKDRAAGYDATIQPDGTLVFRDGLSKAREAEISAVFERNEWINKSIADGKVKAAVKAVALHKQIPTLLTHRGYTGHDLGVDCCALSQRVKGAVAADTKETVAREQERHEDALTRHTVHTGGASTITDIPSTTTPITFDPDTEQWEPGETLHEGLHKAAWINPGEDYTQFLNRTDIPASDPKVAAAFHPYEDPTIQARRDTSERMLDEQHEKEE